MVCEFLVSSRHKDFNGPNIHLSILLKIFPTNVFRRIFPSLYRLLSRLQLQCNTGIQIVLCKYRNISTTTNILRACNQEDFTSEVYVGATRHFSGGEVFWNKGTPISISSTTHKRKSPNGKILEYLLLDTIKT